MTNAGVAPAKSLKLAEAVKLKDHGGESWLEKQIKSDPRLLGLDAVTVVSTQVTHKGAGRLDLLATDEDENKYVIEIMLGQLDASHVTRSLDYWLREKKREKSDQREPIAVIAAEDIQGSRFYDVLKFLSKAMPLIAIEMKVHKAGNKLILIPVPLIDSAASTDSVTADVNLREDMNEAAWRTKTSKASVDLIVECGDILKRIAPGTALNWTNRVFVGLTVNNKARNFIVFKPKQNWVRVQARFLPDSEKWRKKLKNAGLQTLGGRPGRSVHFRLTRPELKKNLVLCRVLFTECYKNRTGQKS